MNLFRLAGALFLAGLPPGRAEITPASPAVLQNLPSVGVRVGWVSHDGVVFGMSNAELVRAVAVPLQQAGVRVLPAGERPAAADMPMLEIGAHVIRIGIRGRLYLITLQLCEAAQTARNPSPAPAVTWQAVSDGYSGRPEQVFRDCRELARRFVAEWGANPRR